MGGGLHVLSNAGLTHLLLGHDQLNCSSRTYAAESNVAVKAMNHAGIEPADPNLVGNLTKVAQTKVSGDQASNPTAASKTKPAGEATTSPADLCIVHHQRPQKL